MFVVKENSDFQGGFPLLVYFGFSSVNCVLFQ